MNRLALFFRLALKILLRVLLLLVLFNVLLFVLYIGVSIIFPSSDWFSGNNLIAERLHSGFGSFLDENISRISWNAATWGPGLGAFMIATLFVHRYLSRWAKRTGREWSFLTSFCLVMIVPVLFVISFIVPGVLLQWDALREVVWIDVR